MRPRASIDEEWEKSAGDLCPSCGQRKLRFNGRVCSDCALRIPGELAEKLTRMGLPASVAENTIRAVLFDHAIELDFSPSQSLIYYRPARQAERRLFHALEEDLKRWVHERGLSFATREGIA